MNLGFYIIMAAQFFSSLADNALLVAAIAMLMQAHEPSWLTPYLKFFFVLSYVILAPYVGAIADRLPKGQVMLISNTVKIAGCVVMLFGVNPLAAYALVGLGAAAFYFYMVIDSYQTAKAKQLGQPAPEWLGLNDLSMDAPLGAGVLIVLGLLFLLDNFGVPVFSQIGKFWPVLLIVLGLALLQKRLAHHETGGPQGQEPPGQKGENQKPPGPTQL